MSQVFNLADLVYNKTTKTILIPRSKVVVNGAWWPKYVKIKSHKTNRVVTFFPVEPGHPKFDEDYWDGEQQVYAPAKGEAGYKISEVTVAVYNGE